jgi:hypothetical protein
MTVINDRELITLYWKFYTESHINPVLKKYLPTIAQQIRDRKISPIAFNNVGNEVLNNGALYQELVL